MYDHSPIYLINAGKLCIKINLSLSLCLKHSSYSEYSSRLMSWLLNNITLYTQQNQMFSHFPLSYNITLSLCDNLSVWIRLRPLLQILLPLDGPLYCPLKSINNFVIILISCYLMQHFILSMPYIKAKTFLNTSVNIDCWITWRSWGTFGNINRLQSCFPDGSQGCDGKVPTEDCQGHSEQLGSFTSKIVLDKQLLSLQGMKKSSEQTAIRLSSANGRWAVRQMNGPLGINKVIPIPFLWQNQMFSCFPLSHDITLSLCANQSVWINPRFFN